MAQIQTYECDICKITKKEVNHWWIGVAPTCDEYSDCISIAPIDKEDTIQIEDKNEVKIVHLCGFDCVTKWLHQQMQEIINRENANRTAGSDKEKV
jgi:hypothetical protein